MSMIIIERRCASCTEVYALTADNFHRNSAQLGGFEYRCKKCERVRARWRNMLRLYGLTQDDYNAMLEAQGGVCAVCKQPPSGGIVALDRVQVFDIDHDHAEGLNRGLLCRRCNLTLGNVDDDPALLRALADYLEAHTRP